MPPDALVPTSSLRALLTLVVVAAFLVMGMVAISWVVRLDTPQWLAASMATAAMGGLTVRLATQSPLRAGASVGCTVGWALLMGLVNVPVSFIAASVVEQIDFHIVPLVAFATVIGAPFGLMLGLLFGLALCVPVAALMRAWQHPSPDANDLAVVVSGLWLALAAGFAAMLASPTIDPEFPLWSGEASPQRAWLPLGAAWVLGGLGLPLAAAAARRRAARRRFVARVARGRVPAWRVVEAPPERATLEALPCLGATARECEHLLVRREHTGEGAYRRTATEWPVAWVPRAWVRGELPLTAPRG